MEKVKVAIRVRPMNKREIELGTQNIINVIESNQISITNIQNSKEGRKSTKKFAYDYCFDSSSTDRPNYATQEIVYNCIGLDIINNAFNGYNSCIFAYGQTGSGKSYTMTGSIDNIGLIPRICEGLFNDIKNKTNLNDNKNLVKIEVSYMEIYNEKVLDLLDPRGVKNNLKVREHKLLGPYVDGLSQLAVSSYKDIEVLINEGNKSRTVAATNMNSESSRSHAVFCLKISQTIIDTQTGISGEKVSKLSLVDLAGSEKASKTGVEGERLKEGCNINRSLLTLGIVISALAENVNTTNNNNNNKAKHIPYRDSVLTWLLKDSLGGNSKTVMIATISPAFDNYEETMSTLKYADRAKRIVNHAVVNEDPNAKLIRELREEIEILKKKLTQAKTNNELVETLNETENIYKELSRPWDEKLAETQNVQREWSHTLEKLGISVQSSGIKVEKDKFYLVNMSADPSMNELLVYYLKDSTIVGRINSKNELDIQLSGPGIADEHCVFEIRDNEVYVMPLNVNAKTRVNGTLINDETLLHHGDRIVLGVNHYFRINCPNKNNKHNDRENHYSYNNTDNNENNEYDDMNGDYDDEIDYAGAQKEILLNDDDTCFQNAFDLKHNKFDDINMNSNNEIQEQKIFKIPLTKLQEQLIKANTLVREANVLSKEMNKKTIFSVTLQISPSNLKLNSNKDVLLFEPAISVKRTDRNLQQTWSLEKFENRIVDMREMYSEIQNRDQLSNVDSSNFEDENDPFYEALENHKLIGVANLFLDSLYCDCKFDYSIPIINQQGDIAGYLKVQLSKDKHYTNDMDDIPSSNNSQVDTISENSDDIDRAQVQKKTIKCILKIKEAIGLPFSLSNFVFCQYKFWNESNERCVAPEADDEAFKLNKLSLSNKYSFLSGISIKFNRSEEHIVKVNEDFIDYCADASLPIEVWGHHNITDDPQQQQQQQENFENSFLFKYANLIESWQQVRKSFKLWVDILEIDKNGQWAPVNVKTHKKNHSGGIYQLKQGHSKRIKIRIEEKSIYRDLLPLYIEDISSIEVGCVQLYNTNQNDKIMLDSYQEEDLANIRKIWLNYLDQRKVYYEAQCKLLIEKQDKSLIDNEREKYLYDQLVELAEERNLVETPPENSHLPGSTLAWKPDPGMEENIPIIFLGNNDSQNDSISHSSDDENQNIYGNKCLLANEEPDNEYFILPVINKQLNTLNNNNNTNNIEAIAIWDSTIHEDNALNLVTQNDNFVYLIVKIKLKLVQPIQTEVYIRKRICVQIYDPNSNNNATVIITNVKNNFSKFFKNLTTNITGSQLSLVTNSKDVQKNEIKLTSTGVTYYFISNIPRCIEDYEQYDNLAIMAAITNPASSTNTSSNLIERYLEKYMKCIKSVDSLLKNDKKQQELALQQAIRNEISQKQSNNSSSKTSLLRLSNSNLNNISQNLIKTTSVPNLLNSKSLKFGSTQNISKIVNKTAGVTNNNKLLSSTPEQPIQQQQQPKMYTPIIVNQQEPIIKNGANRFNKNPTLKQNNLTKKLDTIVKPKLNTSLLINLNQTNDTSNNINLNTTAPAILTTENINVSFESTQPVDTTTTTTIKTINHKENVDGTIPIINESIKPTPISENENQTLNKLTEEIKAPIIKIDTINEDESKTTTPQQQQQQTKLEANILNEQITLNNSLTKTQMSHSNSETSISNDNERDKLPEWMKENTHVIVSTNTVLNQPGIIRFIGETKFAKGIWIGVELERERGLNDGSIKGHRYFQCPPEKGVFVRADKLTLSRIHNQ